MASVSNKDRCHQRAPRTRQSVRQRVALLIRKVGIAASFVPEAAGEIRRSMLDRLRAIGRFVRIHTFVAERGCSMAHQDALPIALRRAYLAMHRRSDAQFAEHGVTADQFVLLATLARGDALTQRELAARMPSDPSTVRAMLVLLEQRGLVTRDVHPEDARARTVALTKAGLRKYQQVWEAGQSLRDQMVDDLTAQETKTLVALLQRVAESLTGSSPVEVEQAET